MFSNTSHRLGLRFPALVAQDPEVPERLVDAVEEDLIVDAKADRDGFHDLAAQGLEMCDVRFGDVAELGRL